MRIHIKLAHGLAAVALTTLAVAQLAPTAPRVATLDDRVLGTVLVDDAGNTLYVRIGETAGSLDCTNAACLATWAPASSGRADPSEQLTTFTRPDGSAQLSYLGQPLYTARGAAPGEMSANGTDGVWFAANALPLVTTAFHATAGDILVGPNGRTLYVYDGDVGEEAGYQCDEGCSENFPPLVVSHRTFVAHSGSGSAAQLAVLARQADSVRADRLQVTYAGRPLYYFARDVSPGDVKGDGIAGLWRVARPADLASR